MDNDEVLVHLLLTRWGKVHLHKIGDAPDGMDMEEDEVLMHLLLTMWGIMYLGVLRALCHFLPSQSPLLLRLM